MTRSMIRRGALRAGAASLAIAIAHPWAGAIDFEVSFVCAGMPWCSTGAPPIATEGAFYQFDLPTDFPPSHVLASLMPEIEFDSYIALDGANVDGVVSPTTHEYTAPMPTLADVAFEPWLASFSATTFYDEGDDPLAVSLRQSVGGVEADMVFIGRFTVVGGDGSIEVGAVEIGVRPVGFESDHVIVAIEAGLADATALFGSEFFLHVHTHASPFGTVSDVYVAADGVEVDPVACAEDLNTDGVVDAADLNLLLFDFGCAGACGPSDMNADGKVDAGDLNVLLYAFGGVCG